MTNGFGLCVVAVGGLGTNCYLYWEKETRRALIVDPGEGDGTILAHLRENDLALEAVLLTHGHYDHVMALPGIMRAWPDVPVIAGDGEKEVMTSGRGAYPSASAEAAGYITRSVKDGEVLSLIGTNLTVLHTPGHSKGSVCYYDPAQELLFSGDTLFRESCGRVDLTGGNAREMRQSLGRLKREIPDQVIVLPGHMEWTDMAHEKAYNVYMDKA